MLSTAKAVEAIRHHGLGLADAAEGNFDAKVACCPGWNVADLVWHVRQVHHVWGSIVDGLLADRSQVPEIDRPNDNKQLLADYRAGVLSMADVLAQADQTAWIWTWSHQKDVAFVTRHQVQEAAVHHWDAADVAGQKIEIDPVVAADSVDEFLEHSTPARYQEAVPLEGTVHFHANDTDGEWIITEEEDRTLSTLRGHGHADVALSAAASDLLLTLYRRITPEQADIHGDKIVLERFLARTDLD